MSDHNPIHSRGLTELEENVLEFINHHPGWTAEEIEKAIDDPDWDSTNVRYDWRSHVLPEFQAEWSRLAIDVRLGILAHAQCAAQAEYSD